MDNIFVCDFDEVANLSKTIESSIDSLQKDLTNGKENLLSTLGSNWQGESFSTFSSSLTEKHDEIDKKINSTRTVIEAVKEASKKIAELEEELASYEV